MSNALLISTSSDRTLNECARKFFWQKEFLGTGIEPEYSTSDKITAADEGLAIHYAQANLYSLGRFNPQGVTDAIMKGVGFEGLAWHQKNDWLKQIEWTVRLTKEYDKWRQVNDDFSVHELETEGIVPIFDNCRACGETHDPQDLTPVCQGCNATKALFVFRIDMLVNRNNFFTIVDHKSTTSSGQGFLDQWNYSVQMYRYAWAYSRRTGKTVKAFGVNILKRLKTVGLEEDKQCPGCKNGVRKKLTCLECSGEGMVPKASIPPEKVFFRKWPVWNERTKHWAVDSLQKSVRKLEGYRINLELAQYRPDMSDDPYPTNPHACYAFGKVCPFIKLCPPFQKEGEPWWKPSDAKLMDFQQRKESDQVTMIKEEMK